MKSWQEQLLSSLDAAGTTDEQFAVISREGEAIGFDYCAYGVRLPLPIANPRIEMLSNYPKEWQERYVQVNYAAVDPLVQYGAVSQLPFIWDDTLFQFHPQFYEEARSFGLTSGWAQASVADAGVRGLLTLTRTGAPVSEVELNEHSLRMAWLCHTAHIHISKRLIEQSVPERQVQLTDREIAVLRWTAEGKTSSETSDIMGISGRTVNFHIANAMSKLNCVNKTAATIKASVLGFL